MPRRERLYRPISSEGISNDASNIATKLMRMVNLKGGEILQLGPIGIFPIDFSDPIDFVNVLTKNINKKKARDEFSEEINIELERLKKEQDLTQREIDKLKRELRKKEIKKLEVDQQIEIIQRRAKDLGDERRRTKIKQKFDSEYRKFFEILNDDLLDLKNEDKEDTKVRLKNMNEMIKTMIKKLS